MPAHGPRTSILIPAYNEERLLPETLAAVRDSFAALDEKSYEIVVCDNNSTDRTAAIAHGHGARVVFEPHNQIARARNAATAQSRGEWLIYLDADTLLNPQLLEATLRALESGRICGGGSVIQFGKGKPNHVGAALTALWNTVSRTLDLAAGSYLFCLRPACEAIGGFDESLYASEEIAFSRAVKRWGRERRLHFRVLTEAPILTSARKLEWYGQWRLLRTVALFALRPWAVKKRDACKMWYTRPPE
jgi:glycosyltransferase involved in cell wall biosynthesis